MQIKSVHTQGKLLTASILLLGDTHRYSNLINLPCHRGMADTRAGLQIRMLDANILNKQ
jgi:hypothetical protein